MKKETIKNIFESLLPIIQGIIAVVLFFFVVILFFVIWGGLSYLVSLIPYVGPVLKFIVGIIGLIIMIIAIINFGSGSRGGGSNEFRRL